MDVAVVGVPFDSGVSYRPGARFGPAHIRQSSRLLRPFNPALGVSPFAALQVVDAGDLAVNPFDIQAGDRRDRGRAPAISARRAKLLDPRRRPHDRRCRCCARCTPSTGRSRCCTSTPTSTRGTPTSASRTRTARRSAAPPRRGCSTRSTACTSASAARCTTSTRPAGVGRPRLRRRARDRARRPRRRRHGRADARPARRPAGLRVGRHRRARPGARTRHRHAGGRRHDLARAAGRAARPARAATSCRPTSSRSRRPTTTPRSPASPPRTSRYELLSVLRSGLSARRASPSRPPTGQSERMTTTQDRPHLRSRGRVRSTTSRSTNGTASCGTSARCGSCPTRRSRRWRSG